MRTVRGGGEPQRFEPPRTPNQARITGAFAEESLRKNPDVRTAFARLFACSVPLFLLVTAGHAFAFSPIDSFRFNPTTTGPDGTPFLELAQKQLEASPPDARLTEAFESFKVGDYDRAIATAKPLAEGGDAQAQYLLALVYWWPGGPRASDENTARREALDWAEKSAQQRHPGGKYLYGSLLLIEVDEGRLKLFRALRWIREAAYEGLSVAQADFAGRLMALNRYNREIVTLGLRSARAGELFAQLVAGLAYLRGLGTRRDLRQAALSFRRLAQEGIADGQAFYAFQLAYGIGVEEDPVAALMWLDIAKALGWNRDDMAGLEEKLISGMTPAEIETSRSRASHWLQTALKDEGRALGRAARWCAEFQPDDRTCLRLAVVQDAACLPPDLPSSPKQGFRGTPTYNGCRQALHRESWDKPIAAIGKAELRNAMEQNSTLDAVSFRFEDYGSYESENEAIEAAAKALYKDFPIGSDIKRFEDFIKAIDGKCKETSNPKYANALHCRYVHSWPKMPEYVGVHWTVYVFSEERGHNKVIKELKVKAKLVGP